MPAKRDSDKATPATPKKPRARKPRAAAGAAAKAESKPRRAAAKSADKPATPRRRAASPRKPRVAPPAALTEISASAEPETPPAESPAPVPVAATAPVITASEPSAVERAPLSILPVSPEGPAAERKRLIAPPPAPAPASHWRWAGAPVAATVAFLATLGALLMGYWTGYSVGSEAMGETGVTVASAAEKAPTIAMPEEQLIRVEPLAPAEPAIDAAEAPAEIEPEPAPPETAQLEAQPAEGLHLQVSALRSEKAATALQRQLESRGFPVRVETPAKGKLVRVYVGPVADAADLSEWTSELRKEGLQPFPKRL